MASFNDESASLQDDSDNTLHNETKRSKVSVVVTGIAAALPGRDQDVFRPGVNNVQRIIDGESFLSAVPDQVKDLMLAKNTYETVKDEHGVLTKRRIEKYDRAINVCASLGRFDLTAYGVSESIAATMDIAVQVAVAAGLEALKDAHLVSGEGVGTSGWELPAELRATTGIVYATSFPALDTAVGEVSKYFNTRTVQNMDLCGVVDGLRARLEAANGSLSAESEAALQLIHSLAASAGASQPSPEPYEFDKKFLFRVLVLGNAQLAQIVKAKGPNMQTNAACAGATQAIALAYDMIQVGRAQRVVVIAGDSASSDTLMPWLGNGFRVLGAATTESSLQRAATPFSAGRSGMILGSGGIGMVLESEAGARERHALGVAAGTITTERVFRCRLLSTLVSNSAHHGAAMDRAHIAEEMERFLADVEREHGLSRAEIARHGVYFSHETSTHASPTSACAANEVYALRKAFGADLQHLLILNTKGFTGHPMGVSFEDVVAAEVLVSGRVPPIANYSATDPALGPDLKMSRGGAYPCKYALRFAAGFGSQVALALYSTADL